MPSRNYPYNDYPYQDYPYRDYPYCRESPPQRHYPLPGLDLLISLCRLVFLISWAFVIVAFKIAKWIFNLLFEHRGGPPKSHRNLSAFRPGSGNTPAAIRHKRTRHRC